MKLLHTALASVLAATATAVAAPKTPAPSKPDDKEALQRAIDAVDGAKKTADAVAKKTPETGAAKPAPGRDAAHPADSKPAAAPKANPSPKESPAPANSGPKTSKTEPPRTKITSEEDGIFKNKEGIAVFLRNVFVDRPDLKIWCDKLEVTLFRPDAKKAPEAAAPKEGDSDDAFSSKNMKKAVATAGGGSVVVIWRKTEKGEMVANCHEAVYDGATGDIVLKGRPEVLQDLQKYIFGKDEEATVTMLKNGDAKGRVGLEFVQEQKGREYRRRLLSSLPSKRISDIESATRDSSAIKPDAVSPVKPN